MKLDIFCLSDKGCVRSGNQDMAGAGLHLIRDDQTSFVHDLGDGKSFFLLIADGMGGHQHGEMASSYTLEELRDMLFDGSRDWSAPEQLLSGEIRRISDDLNRKSAEMQLDKPMGCTLTGFVLAGGRTLLVNVGDSRTYRLRAGMLRRLTVDQTIHERDMVPFPQGKAIYSCIGGGISPEAVIEDYAGRLLPGDRTTAAGACRIRRHPKRRIRLSSIRRTLPLYRAGWRRSTITMPGIGRLRRTIPLSNTPLTTIRMSGRLKSSGLPGVFPKRGSSSRSILEKMPCAKRTIRRKQPLRRRKIPLRRVIPAIRSLSVKCRGRPMLPMLWALRMLRVWSAVRVS